MYIEKLKLKNYRNYKETEVCFNKKTNIIYGNNAVGKTNLLESIYLSSTSKSQRNSKENEIINFDKEEAHIKIFIKDKSEKEKIIDIQLNKDKKKGVAINGVKIKKISELIGVFNVIIFSPDDLNIIKEGPQTRRKFIDFEILKLDKIYINDINNYNKILNERNALLKKINETKEKKELLEILDTYDSQIVNYGIEVIKKRKENINELYKIVLDKYFYISDKKENLYISYENDVLLKSKNIKKEEIKTIKDLYLYMLKETRDIDIKNQYTQVGPHRDDISFMIEEKDIRKYGSQGQKKTAAISLKLSELEIVKEKINETPILLLDDVFSELDETRQKSLTRNFKENQVMITSVEINE